MKYLNPTPRPARGYSWEPFQPGHTKSLIHGAYSPRTVDPLAEEIAGLILKTGPGFLASNDFALATWSLARTEARLQVVNEWLDTHGPLDEEGNPRPAAGLVLQFERLAVDMRNRLGLDPTSRAKLEQALAGAARDINIAGLVAEGRKVRKKAEAKAARASKPKPTTKAPAPNPEAPSKEAIDE